MVCNPEGKARIWQQVKFVSSLDLLFLTMRMVGANIRCSSVVNKNTADPTNFRAELHVHTALVRFRFLEISINVEPEPGLCSSKLKKQEDGTKR